MPASLPVLSLDGSVQTFRVPGITRHVPTASLGPCPLVSRGSVHRGCLPLWLRNVPWDGYALVHPFIRRAFGLFPRGATKELAWPGVLRWPEGPWQGWAEGTVAEQCRSQGGGVPGSRQRAGEKPAQPPKARDERQLLRLVAGAPKWAAGVGVSRPRRGRRGPASSPRLRQQRGPWTRPPRPGRPL